MARPSSQVAEDLAFADTVVADEELNSALSSRAPNIDADDPMARSGERRRAFRSSTAEGGSATDGSAHNVWNEMHDLWSAARSVEIASRPPRATTSSVRALGRRVRTLWSFFEWERSDLLRAAIIGVVAFAGFASAALLLLRR